MYGIAFLPQCADKRCHSNFKFKFTLIWSQWNIKTLETLFKPEKIKPTRRHWFSSCSRQLQVFEKSFSIVLILTPLFCLE